jgi:ACS family glucarate transporter-like MFS transporter
MTYRRFWVYFLLFLLNTISYTDRVNMSLAGHPIAQEFGLSPVTLGYLFSSFLWAYVLMMLPGGRLIDSLGAHRVAAICATFSGSASCWALARAQRSRPRRGPCRIGSRATGAVLLRASCIQRPDSATR